MDEKNRVKLNICGSDFTIVSSDSEDYIRMVGDKVDRTIQGLIDRSPTMSTFRAAVFGALEFCDEAAKATENADRLRAQIQEYLEEAAAAKSETTELRRRELELERENMSLRAKLEKAEKRP